MNEVKKYLSHLNTFFSKSIFRKVSLVISFLWASTASYFYINNLTSETFYYFVHIGDGPSLWGQIQDRTPNFIAHWMSFAHQRIINIYEIISDSAPYDGLSTPNVLAAPLGFLTYLLIPLFLYGLYFLLWSGFSINKSDHLCKKPYYPPSNTPPRIAYILGLLPEEFVGIFCISLPDSYFKSPLSLNSTMATL